MTAAANDLLRSYDAWEQVSRRSRCGSADLARYRDDPVAYAVERLGTTWWAKQQEIARALVRHQKVLVKASHSVGKTHACAGIVLWWYETRSPGIALTTAPTQSQVVDLLWREVRAQAPAGTPLLPKAPRIEGDARFARGVGGWGLGVSGARTGEPLPSGRNPLTPNPHPPTPRPEAHHYAAGYTARDVDAFQGRHEEELLIIFDEATGIDRQFWVAAEGMVTGPENRWLAVLNPTDTSSQAHAAEQSGGWRVVTVTALEHPNVIAELEGRPAPFPKAVRLGWIEGRLREWCTPTVDPAATDLEWPPGSGRWYRPEPLFESRVLGRWPSQAVDAVWSDTLLAVAFREGREPAAEPVDEPCEIGCDVARYGDDMTAMHVRRGPVSLWHERHNGWSTAQTAGRLKLLADEYGRRCGLEGRSIAVKVDDDGVGGGVTDQADGYRFLAQSGARQALEARAYPNRRSERWFALAEMAREGRLDLSRLPEETRQELRRQLMAPRWRLDAQGRRVVEAKAETKARLRRSPDDADALLLAYSTDLGPGTNVLEYYRRAFRE